MHLYHYTDQNGFLGIFENREIWATKIQYLNDFKEYTLAKDLTEVVLNEMLVNPNYKKHSFRIRRFISILYCYIENNMCISSLSEKGDLLSQWRGYSNSQSGYSIGFKKEELSNYIYKQGYGLEKCIYDKQEQKDAISKIILESLEKFKDYVEPDLDIVEGSSDSTEYFFKNLSYLSAYIKDSNFREEKEWRIIRLVNFNDLDFRTGKSSLIPFTKISFENSFVDVVSELIVGHTPSLKLAMDATRSFLIKNYPRMHNGSIEHQFTIKESKIPYRSW